MDAAQVIDLGREALWIAVLVASPLLGVALAVGLRNQVCIHRRCLASWL